MNISKISFGNIVKVNAPILPAMEIVSIANGYTGIYDKRLQKQISSLFPDKQQDNVSIEVMDHKTSYLFSGKDEKEYKKLYHDKKRKINRIKDNKKQSYNIDFLTNQVELEYKKKVEELVKKNSNGIKEIEVETQNNAFSIKSINILS